MDILYEDEQIIVAIKPPNVVSEFTPQKSGMADLLAARTGGYIGVIHRLDLGVGGVTVYAKEAGAAAFLSAALQRKEFEKEYLAVVHGVPDADAETLEDLLFHDRTRNMTFVVDRPRKGVKPAILSYRSEGRSALPGAGEISLLRIRPETGRTHQIRVQFASRKHPLVGDRKYGAKDRLPISLFCAKLTFPHPKTGKKMTCEQLPTGGIWDLF